MSQIMESERQNSVNLVGSEEDRGAEESKVDSTHSANFLLAEFERLKDVRLEIGQKASTRFQFYLTITTAALGACIVFSQTQNTKIPRYIFDLVALGLLVYGAITFLNLTFASTFQVRVLRASRRIQQYFVDRDPQILKYLYFADPPPPPNRHGLLKVLRRGFAGGSEKSLIAFINSALVAYLAVCLLQRYFLVFLSHIAVVVVVTVTFVFSSFLHIFYVTRMYRYELATR